MSRDSSTFKDSYNRALDIVRSIGRGGMLPTETDLATQLEVSRTTVRGVLNRLDQVGIIDWSGRQKAVLRGVRKADYFSDDETATVTERVSSQFMAHILKSELKPGATLTESDLVRQFNVGSTAVREFLIRFSRFGLIEKERNRRWVLRGFTREFAEELFEVRELFETRAYEVWLAAGISPADRDVLTRLRSHHQDVQANIERDYLRFPALDEQFHRVWIEAHGNTFVLDFFELISLVFHYHYRWNRSGEMDRNRQAIVEHLAIIDAVLADDVKAARLRFREHLDQARETMIASALWA